MIPEKLDKKFEKFKAFFLELKKQNEGLNSVNKELRLEITKLKADLLDNQSQIQGFQNRTKIDKIVDELDSEEGKKLELKRLLDQYIEEIDDCINILKSS